jgi:hypothetical protein
MNSHHCLALDVSHAHDTMLQDLPPELLDQVLGSISKDDHQALRLVCKKLSLRVAPTLFRTIYVSCLTLDHLRNIANLSELREHVEELQYQEMDLDLHEPGSTFEDVRLDYFVNTIQDWIAVSDFRESNVYAGPATEHELLHNVRKWLGQWEENEPPSLEVITEIVKSVIDSYDEKAGLQDEGVLSLLFFQTLPRLPKLKRIVFMDAEAGGIALSYARMENEESFKRLREWCPVTDGQLRAALQKNRNAWPSHGLRALWRAMSQVDYKPTIQHLEIRRDHNLFSPRGISIASLSTLVNWCARPPDFSSLKHLTLILEVDICKNQNPNPFDSMTIHTAIATARNLKHLEMTLTSVNCMGSDHTCENNRPWCRLNGNFNKLVPLVSFHQLEDVKFDDFDFTEEEICAWLFRQPALRQLHLIRPRLEGRWRDVVEKWSENPTFQLQSLILSAPWDAEIRQNEGDAVHVGHGLSVPNGKLPSRVSNQALLIFINEGGQNPFDLRRWTYVDSWAAEQHDMVDDHLSDFSDMSEVPDPEDWSKEHKWASGWPLGPEESWDPAEFDHDYRFEQEEDSEGDDEGEELDVEMENLI